MGYFNKNNSFLELTKNQKASLLSHLKCFVKKYKGLCAQEILDEFIEDETYWQDVGNVHFEWIFEYFEKDSFLDEVKMYIKDLLYETEQKERQKPFLEAQKQKAKEMRKKAQEFKMSKTPPTKKQLYYYKKLCERYKIEQVDLSEKSRLDLRNMIDKILKDFSE